MNQATQLQFNLDVPTNIENLQTQFSTPRAIVFERILEKKDRERSRYAGSPVKLSVLSSQKLSKAMQLARRDLKMARRNRALREFAKGEQLDTRLLEENTDNQNFLTTLSSRQTQTTAGKVKKKQKNDSPEKERNVRIKEMTSQSRDVQDIRRLCLELQQLVYRLEKRMNDRVLLYQENLQMFDPDEEQRLIVRHLEQMRKSSRTVYALQRQVQVIKDDLTKSSPVKNQTSKKDRMLNRLAAVHRGAVRLVQTYSMQLPEHIMMSENFVPVNALYQEVFKLMRELFLCSLQLDLVQVGEVQKLLDVLKDIDPKLVQKPLNVTTGRKTKSPAKTPRTPSKSFRSKHPIMVKKSFIMQQKLRNSTRQTYNKSLQKRNNPDNTAGQKSSPKKQEDIFDRPECLPPSNSPYKSVGPAPLGPLFESPLPPKRNKGKDSPGFRHVNFCSTPDPNGASKEHAIDGSPRTRTTDLERLKNELAEELEGEIRERIQPLLQKVEELAQSSKESEQRQKNTKKSSGVGTQEILENQIRDIVRETSREMQNFQKQQEEEIKEQAVNLYQAPSLETLLKRLEVIDKEEETIRRHWRQINYKDMVPETVKLPEPSVGFVSDDPAPINFTNSLSQPKLQTPKRIVRLVPQDSPVRSDVLGRTKRLDMTSRNLREPKPFTGRTLYLPPTTVKAIKKNKKDYERHLRYTFHEVKGQFDPWRLVEDLSDDILEEVISCVTGEVNGACEDYANQIFQQEFAEGPQNSESSILTSAESSLQSNTSLFKGKNEDSK